VAALYDKTCLLEKYVAVAATGNIRKAQHGRQHTGFLDFTPATLACITRPLVAGSIGTGGYLLSDTLSSTLDRVPQIIANLKAKLVTLKSSVDFLSQMRSDVESLTGEVGSAEVAIAQPGILSAAASSAASGLTAFALAALFALILLSSGTLVDEKLVSSAPLLEDKKKTVRILRDVENQVSRYLLTITLINVSLGLVIGTLLSLQGTQNAILWGAIAAVLNFLPYIGAIVGAGFLAIVSLGEQTSIAAALIPPLIYYACSAIEGNLITPLIVGRNLSLNVIAVFVSIVVWSWLWGFAGALMAVPILVVIKVVSDHVDSWKSLGHFLSARESEADGLVLDTFSRAHNAVPAANTASGMLPMRRVEPYANSLPTIPITSVKP